MSDHVADHFHIDDKSDDSRYLIRIFKGHTGIDTREAIDLNFRPTPHVHVRRHQLADGTALSNNLNNVAKLGPERLNIHRIHAG